MKREYLRQSIFLHFVIYKETLAILKSSWIFLVEKFHSKFFFVEINIPHSYKRSMFKKHEFVTITYYYTMLNIYENFRWIEDLKMKFAEHLGAHITPEWRKQYIQYEDMKVSFSFELISSSIYKSNRMHVCVFLYRRILLNTELI